MAITYNAVTNLITLDGANIYTLLDIYNADVAGGWGVVTHVGEMYLFECNMVIGDVGGNATKVIDSNVGFQLGISGTTQTLEIKKGALLEMTRCLLKLWFGVMTTSWGSGVFKDCSICLDSASVSLDIRGGQEYERCEIVCKHWYSTGGTSSWYKCKVTPSGLFYYYTSGVIDDLRIEGNLRAAYYSPTIKNSVITGGFYLQYDGIHATLINCTWGSLAFNFANNYLEDKWEFNVLVTDKDNNPLVALVELQDKNGVLKHSVNTGADGKLPTTWEVLANRYDGTSETKTEYNPFTLKVTKLGYADYETNITIDHIIKDDQIVLDGLTYTYDEIMAGISDIKGTGFIKDTDSLVDIRPETDKIAGIEAETSAIKKILKFIRANML